MGQAAETLLLEPGLGLDQAASLRETLLGRRGGALTLDASQVERISALCFQVLASARQTWAADGHALAFADPSPAFITGVTLMGASDWAAAPQEDILP